MDFRPLSVEERNKLSESLRKNAESDTAIFMKKDTTFSPYNDGTVSDEEVINAIKSVPCHYAE